jgi:8-oxo-dGTP pyrophosphatase MutT (NUDIX family)
MRISTFILGLFALTFLAGCSGERPEQPFCRNSLEQVTPSATPSSCLITDNGNLLVVVNRLSGKFDLPGGRGESDESAACTAHRETFEETGLNVNIVELAGVSHTGLHLFTCIQDAGFHAPDEVPPVPFWGKAEIKSIHWINPYELSLHDWRFPDQFVEVRAAFAKAAKNKIESPESN